MVMKDKLKKHHKSYLSYKCKKISVFSASVLTFAAIAIIPSFIFINSSINNSKVDASKDDSVVEVNDNVDEKEEELLSYNQK